jgi:hypothetical protein
MKKRIAAFLTLCAIHTLPFYVDMAAPLAPLVTGPIYLPLMAHEGMGVSVFSGAESGGWQAVEVQGWVVVILLWATIWWAFAGKSTKIPFKRKQAA